MILYIHEYFYYDINESNAMKVYILTYEMSSINFYVILRIQQPFIKNITTHKKFAILDFTLR